MTTDLKAARRLEALFKAMEGDMLLREQFVTDPAQVLATYLGQERLSDESAEVANQLIFAVMSNPQMREWLIDYGVRAGGEMPSRHELALDFAAAAARHGDADVNLALVRSAMQDGNHFEVHADLLRALVAALGRARGGGVFATEMSPGGGTEMSPGGTEMSPGAAFRARATFRPGAMVTRPGSVFTTEMSPGGGTEMSPGGGTEMSPGAVITRPGTVFSTEMSPGGGTEMSPGGGTEMSPGAVIARPGTVFSTEMSPGGGTEMSPGGGTEMSPGAIFTIPGHLEVTLDALTDFATRLRARGALTRSGLEGR